MSLLGNAPRLHLREEDVVRLVLEFVCSRQFHISQVPFSFNKDYFFSIRISIEIFIDFYLHYGRQFPYLLFCWDPHRTVVLTSLIEWIILKELNAVNNGIDCSMSFIDP